jgi:hypothetical protein
VPEASRRSSCQEYLASRLVTSLLNVAGSMEAETTLSFCPHFHSQQVLVSRQELIQSWTLSSVQNVHTLLRSYDIFSS